MLVNGDAAGTKTQITTFLAASYGGMRHFGVIYGVMAPLMALASGVVPLVAGLIYVITAPSRTREKWLERIESP